MHRLVVALVTLLGLTGVAVVAGYLFLFSAATDQAATLAPAKSAFYANLYLQPSTGQQMNLSGLIGRLPGFADEASLDEKVDQIVQNLLGGSGVDYRGDVKPWLGDQVAVAAWPGSDDPAEAEAVLIAEVKDLDTAEASVADVVADEGVAFEAQTYAGVELQASETAAYAFVGEMLVVGSAVDGIHAVVDTTTGAESLADRADFRSTMAALPPDHLASVFVDLAAIAESTGVEGQFENLSTASAVLVAERDGLRLSGSAPLERTGASAAPAPQDAGEPGSLVAWMPDDTVAEVTVFDLRGVLEDAEAAASTTPEGQELSGTLDTLRAIAAFGLGIDLDADLLPLLDREVAIALGGFDGLMPTGQLLLRADDPDAAAEALDRVAERLGAIGATREEVELEGIAITSLSIPELGDVSYAAVEDVIILALTPDEIAAAVAAHASGESLGASQSYLRTFEVAGTRAGTEAYVDVGTLVDLAGDTAELPADARDILLQVGSFGLTIPSRDDQIEFHAVLTVDEP